MPDLSGNWDYIVVGGGSAGSVVASRLCEDPGTRVLLVEAGRDVDPATEPADIQDPYPYQAAFNPDYRWPGLQVHFGTQTDTKDAPRGYEQARLMGGGSSINGLLANRGTPDDYDDWAARGAAGWGWNEVLPYFRKLETDTDASDESLHGRDGPIRITRVPERDWPGFSTAARDAFAAAQFRAIPDQNGEFGDGWFPMAVSSDGARRVSAARGYLDSNVRARFNLTVLPSHNVDRILFEGRQAVGVATNAGDLLGREIILCAGALLGPALLMRSGIGPADHLRSLGLTVTHDLQGVGGNLQEHPSLALSAFLKPGQRMGPAPRRHVHVGLRYSSGEGPRSDMFLVAVARGAWHPLGIRIGSLFGWVNKPFSTGRVQLTSADPAAYPDVRFALLEDPVDLSRMLALFRRMAALFASPSLAAATADPFAARHGALASLVREPTLRNRFLTTIPAMMVDGPAFLRRAVSGILLAPGFDLGATLADAKLLEKVVRSNTIGGWHPCGTCRMGPAGDRGSVVDPVTARVHGVAGLRVIDASVMPAVPRANTNIPTIMLAEKFIEAIRNPRRS